MDRSRIIPGLRFAISAVFWTLGLTFLIMWARSYSTKDDLRGIVGNSMLNIQSLRGELGIGCWAWQFKPIDWQMNSEKVESTERLWPPMENRLPLSILGIRWQAVGPNMTLFAVSYWTLISISALLSAIPWIFQLGWQFKLRTLLIAITFIAIVLGLIVAFT